MAPAARTGYFVYVATAGDNRITVLRMASADAAPNVVETIDVTPGVTRSGMSTPMALAPDRRFLFVALRTPPLPVLAFSIDPNDGRLSEVGRARLPASTPYILTDRTGRFLFSVANPGATLAVSRIDGDGRIAGRAHQVVHIGHKVHCIAVDETNRFVYVSSTDDGEIFQFRLDAASGFLDPNDPPSVVLGDGGDPRHMLVSPDERFLYTTTEAGGRIACFAVDRVTGRLTEQAGAPMMPASFSGQPSTADLHITPDGTFLYASERALSRIVGYRIDSESGALAQVEDVETETKPRAFAIAPDGSFLVVAGEASGRLSAYAIDPASGKLAKGFEMAIGPKPSWIELV